MIRAMIAACRSSCVVALLGATAVAGRAQQSEAASSLAAELPQGAGPAHAPAPPAGRPVTLHFRAAPLKDVLREIARQSGLELVYSKAVVPLDQRISIKVDSAPPLRVLRDVLDPLGVMLQPNGRAWLLVPKSQSARAVQPGMIVGRVTDARTGQPVAAAEILLDRTRWHTTTDSTGHYRLAEVDEGAYTFLARRLGYQKYTRRVTVRADVTDTVTFTLEPAAAKLDELVTTATGKQRRRDLGNAITTIHADSIMQHAVIRNLTDLLGTRVPGLTVQHSTGAPGDPARLRLRGLGSVTRSNDPIIIVDGVRIYSAQSEERSGNLTNFGDADIRHTSTGMGVVRVESAPAPSPLDQIDPNTIETIDVFKGPSAATLYGPDAANGVIVITTKRGKPGPTTWSGSVAYGRTTTPGRYPTAYFRWGHNLFNDTPGFCLLIDTQCTVDSLVKYQALNDPKFTILGGHGDLTTMSLSASGGSKALLFNVTGSYEDELGPLRLPDFEVQRFEESFNRAPTDWMRRPHHYKQWNVSSNVTAVLSPQADITMMASLARSEQQRASLENQLITMAGTYVDTVNGTYYRPWAGGTIGSLEATPTILQDYYKRLRASTLTFRTGVRGTWRPASWFDASGTAGLEATPRDDDLLLPSGLVSPTDSGAIIRGTGRSLVSTLNAYGEFKKPLGAGFRLLTSIGFDVRTETTNQLVSSASGLLPGTSSLSGARRITATEGRARTSSFGWAIEPKLVNDRFSITTGMRLDGGSAYGGQVRGALGLKNLLSLPKLGGAWVISEEPFFPWKSLFSSLKLRGSYGHAQVQPGIVDRERLYQRHSNDDNGLVIRSLGNTQIRPERSTELEGGFDADILDSRVSLEVTGYRKIKRDALMNVEPPPSVKPGASILQNVGTIRNTGVELTLTVVPVRSSGVTLSSEMNFTSNTNDLAELGPGVTANPLTGLVAGYPIGSRWARPILGYTDRNGDGVLQATEVQIGDSMVYMGRLYPERLFSLHNNLALFNGAIGVTTTFTYETGATQIDETARLNWVLERALVDPTAPLGEQAAVLASDALYFQTSDPPTLYGLIHDISTFRFEDLSVNYRVPPSIARALGARQLMVAVQGKNLAMHSTYGGRDPDVNTWSAGEGIVDAGAIAQSRTWRFSVNMQF